MSYDAALKFMNLQLRLNMSDRGWIEPTYYQLGSDYRGNLTYLLSYMSQMGGWSIVDHALHFATDPTDYLRLGYASSLSSWALVNSGTEASGCGVKENPVPRSVLNASHKRYAAPASLIASNASGTAETTSPPMTCGPRFSGTARSSKGSWRPEAAASRRQPGVAPFRSA